MVKFFQKINLSRWLYDYVPLLLWLALIFWFSSRSTLVDMGSEAGDKLFYKTAHMTVYAILTWLWWRAISPQRQPAWSLLWLAVLFTALYAVSDEIHQRFVPGRQGQLADVLFDVSGALAMILLIRRVKWRRAFPAMAISAGQVDKNLPIKVK